MSYLSNRLYNIIDIDKKFIELYCNRYNYIEATKFVKELNESLAVKRFITENSRRYIDCNKQDFIDRAILITNSFWGCTLDKQALATIHIITLYDKYYNYVHTNQFTNLCFEALEDYVKKSGTKKVIIELLEWLNKLFVTNNSIYSKLLNSTNSFLDNCETKSKSWCQLEYCILCYYLIMRKFVLGEQTFKIVDQIGEEIDRHCLFFNLQKLPQTNNLLLDRTREYLDYVTSDEIENLSDEAKKKIKRNICIVPFNLDYRIDYNIKRTLKFKELFHFITNEIYSDVENLVIT